MRVVLFEWAALTIQELAVEVVTVRIKAVADVLGLAVFDEPVATGAWPFVPDNPAAPICAT